MSPAPAQVEEPRLVVLMDASGAKFQVFRVDGGVPVEVTREYEVHYFPMDDGSGRLVRGFHVGRRDA